MKELFDAINKKVNHLIFGLIIDGLILTVLAVLIVWVDFMLQLTAGLIVLLVAFAFFYGAYKIAAIRRDVKKFFDVR